MENSIEEDEDCINAIYSQMKVKNDNDEDIQYYKKEIQSIKNIVDNYLKEKARADKLEKEYSIMLSQLDEREINYKRVLKENEELKADNYELNNRINDLLDNISIQKVKDKIEELEKWIYTGENAPQDFLQYRIKAKIQVLQELIEGRK